MKSLGATMGCNMRGTCGCHDAEHLFFRDLDCVVAGGAVVVAVPNCGGSDSCLERSVHRAFHGLCAGIVAQCLAGIQLVANPT